MAVGAVELVLSIIFWPSWGGFGGDGDHDHHRHRFEAESRPKRG